jgi:hypothetical protein
LPTDVVCEILSFLPLRERVLLDRAEWLMSSEVVCPGEDTRTVIRAYLGVDNVWFRVPVDRGKGAKGKGAKGKGARGKGARGKSAKGIISTTTTTRSVLAKDWERVRLERALVFDHLIEGFGRASILGLDELYAFRELRELRERERQGGT